MEDLGDFSGDIPRPPKSAFVGCLIILAAASIVTVIAIDIMQRIIGHI